ncbi:MAG: amidohydrolase family protein [Halobacteriota archaeon]
MLELEHTYRVVDVHASIDPSGVTRTDGSYAIGPERLELEMHQAGIVKSVVFAPTKSGRESYLSANNAVARLSVDRPFVAFARITGAIDPRDGLRARLHNLRAQREEWHTSPSDIEQYGLDHRFHGFKLHPPRDGLPDEEVLDALETIGEPVLVHAGRKFPPSAVERTLLRRDLPVIIEHFGGYPRASDLADRAIDLLDSYDQCFLETSFVGDRVPIERAMNEHPDRICFGSGSPAVHPNVGMMEILTLNVSEDKLKRAFSENPCSVIPALGPGASD